MNRPTEAPVGRKPWLAGSDRRQRVIAAATLAPIAIVAVLWLPTSWLAAGVAAVLLAGLWEWTLLAGLTARLPRALFLLANALMMASLIWAGGRGLFTLQVASLIGAAWWLLALAWLWRFDFAAGDDSQARILKLLAGSLCVIPAWSALGWLHAGPEFGARWALFVLLLVWAADSGAYFAGMRFGQRKLAPRISPGKSWEGVCGGAVATVLLAALVWPLLGLTAGELPALLFLTLLTTGFSVAGDLFESLMKRHSGIKDSGSVIPGHGGILDRLDSLFAALPVFAVGKAWLGL